MSRENPERVSIGNVNPAKVTVTDYGAHVLIPFDASTNCWGGIYVETDEIVDDDAHPGKKALSLDPSRKYGVEVNMSEAARDVFADDIVKQLGEMDDEGVARVRVEFAAPDVKEHVNRGIEKRLSGLTRDAEPELDEAAASFEFE